jgi:hypothetical protein
MIYGTAMIIIYKSGKGKLGHLLYIAVLVGKAAKTSQKINQSKKPVF